MKAKYLTVLLCLSLVACHNIPSNNTLNIDQSQSKFNKKSFEDDDLGWTYKGNWNYGNPLQENGSNPVTYTDPNSGTGAITNTGKTPVIKDLKTNFVAESIVDKFVSSVAYEKNGAWNVPSLQTYSVNDGIPIKVSSQGDFISSDGLNSSQNESFPDYHKSNSGLPATLENDGNSDNINVVKNLVYKKLNTSYNFSQSNQVGWKTKKKSPNSNDTYSYNYNLTKDNSIEFEFYGTNFNIPLNSGQNPGWNDIKLTLIKGNTNGTAYDENNSSNILINQQTQSLVNTSNSIKDISKSGLKRGWYKVRIQSNTSSSTGKNSFLFSFDKVQVYPSYQFTVNNTPNITFNSYGNNSMGKAKVTIRKFINQENMGISPVYQDVFDFYSNSVVLSNIKFDQIMSEMSDYIVTIDALPDKNISSLGYGINVESFEKYSFARNDTLYKDPVLYFRTGSNFGTVSIYLDKIKVKDLDLYSPNADTKAFAISDLNTPTNPNIINTNIPHHITIVSNYNLNKSISRYSANFDMISERNKAIFQFNTDNQLGILDFRGSKGSDMGMLKLTLYQKTYSNEWVQVSNKISDLYYNQANSVNNFDINESYLQQNIDVQQTQGTYKIEIESNYTKNPLSTGYRLGINRIFLKSSSTVTADSIADSICD